MDIIAANKKLSLMIYNYLNSNKIEYDLNKEQSYVENEGDEQKSKSVLIRRWLALKNALNKTISLVPRTVYYSDCFENSKSKLPDTAKTDLNILISKLEKGEDVRSNLSNGVFKSEAYDYILNHWNIMHFHISKQVEFDQLKMSDRTTGNRSDYTLFAIITVNTAFLIDVREHPNRAGYTAFSFLEIIERNGWLQQAGLGFLPDNEYCSDFHKNPSDEEIYQMYKSNINYMFIINGKLCGDIGVSIAGNKNEHMFEFNQFYDMWKSTIEGNSNISIDGIETDDKEIIISLSGLNGQIKQIKWRRQSGI